MARGAALRVRVAVLAAAVAVVSLATGAGAQCTGCTHGTSGPCQNEANGVCYPFQGGTCHPALTHCPDADAVPATVTLCAGCLPVHGVAADGLEASPGPCMHDAPGNNLCYVYQSQSDPPSCPVGSSACAGTPNALPRAASTVKVPWGTGTDAEDGRICTGAGAEAVAQREKKKNDNFSCPPQRKPEKFEIIPVSPAEAYLPGT